MNNHPSTASRAILLRPRTSAVATGAAVVLAILTPLFVLLYLIAIPAGNWEAVAAVHGIALAALVCVLVYSRRAGLLLTMSGLIERDLFGGPRTVRRSDVVHITVIDVFEWNSAEARPHLFATDDTDTVLLRLRGFFWTPDAMQRVSEHLGIPIERWEHPRDLAEVRAAHPSWLYSYEMLLLRFVRL